ncbi:MAG: hypothetical protein DRO09_01720 [Thermoprotei archaeon]|nr:MAG: hypothetical protein DRO09_01720 [Thermoprotei archaeon]
MRTKFVMVRLNEVEYEQLRRYAKRWGISMAEAIREAIRNLINFERTISIPLEDGSMLVINERGQFVIKKSKD